MLPMRGGRVSPFRFPARPRRSPAPLARFERAPRRAGGGRVPLEPGHAARVTPPVNTSFLTKEDRCIRNCYGPLPRPDMKIFSVHVNHDGSRGAPTKTRYGSHVPVGGSAQC